MKITRLETFHVKPRWLFLKVHTDHDSIVGWGEPVLEGKAKTVEACVHELGRMIIGQDPRRIEHLWQVMFRGSFYRGGAIIMSAISGIEHALWDILGKSLNAPAYQLLGGHVREKIRVYAQLGTDWGDDYRPRATKLFAEKRFGAFKMAAAGPFRIIETPQKLKQIVDLFAEVRQLAGPGVDIAIDLHGRVSPAFAIQICKALEPYGPMFVEEPVQPLDMQAIKRISSSTSVPIATGERLVTRWQFQEIIEQEAVAVVQPDISHCGGIFELRKIAAMAESRNIAVAPHCPLGPITLAASLQVDACMPNFLCQEQVSLGADYLKKAFEVKDGFIALPTGPGLGIEVDEQKVKAGVHEGNWDNPMYRAEDGAVADW